LKTLRAVAATVATLALLVAAMWIKDQELPLQARASAPLGPTGEVGETVGNRIFQLRVDRYEVARSLQGSRGTLGGRDEKIVTNQLFLIVYARVWSHEKPLSTSKPRIVTADGLSYLESSRLSASVGSLFRSYQPQLWYTTVIPFELPKNALEGAHLVVDDRGVINLLPAKVEIDLGIDKATAAKLRARPKDSFQVKVS